jgi:hypothetical protein
MCAAHHCCTAAAVDVVVAVAVVVVVVKTCWAVEFGLFALGLRYHTCSSRLFRNPELVCRVAIVSHIDDFERAVVDAEAAEAT